jgi:hypothetical protein
LASNPLAYSALCQIVTRRRDQRGRSAPLLEQLGSLDPGLFLLSDDLELLSVLVKTVGPARLRALLVRPSSDGRDSAVIAGARKLGVPLLADLDATALAAHEEELARVMRAIHQGRRVDQEDEASRSAVRPLRGPAEVA